MIINRAWAVANKWTFTIKPVADLLARYVGNGEGWIDPFAGMYSPAEIRNDINKETKAEYHLDALEFIRILNGNTYNGCLFDPPYSLEQCKRSYESHGLQFNYDASHECVRWSKLKYHISRKIKPGGYTISFGWNSNGFGKARGFAILEILLIAHGSAKNDTIVTVERKIQHGLELA